MAVIAANPEICRTTAADPRKDRTGTRKKK
jgi:hypothetical protein